MRQIIVAGSGAVSPAGWGVPALLQTLQGDCQLPGNDLQRPGWARPMKVRTVPAPETKPLLFAHPRLRRSSPITQYAAFAAQEAVGEDKDVIAKAQVRLGVILAVNCGCVIYSRRFYDEALKDPSKASPLLFPETVFNAPASHVATLLGTNAPAYTLMGDQGSFLVALSIGANWLLTERVDACLVIGAEEMDWLIGYATGLFDAQVIPSEGAGALYLKCAGNGAGQAELLGITDPYPFKKSAGRESAASKLRGALAPVEGCLLCDGLQGAPRTDKAEAKAWADWKGCRVSPKRKLGEGLTAAGAWQCVVAANAVASGKHPVSYVSIVGCNQQAIGAIFGKS
jgi:3-oxoacyl-(acyl-carrier-protein) synthase